MTDHVDTADGRDREAGTCVTPVGRPWVRPVLEELPPLSSLTLASGDPIGGGGDTGGGGSTVF
jgi:hypothetical protein